MQFQLISLPILLAAAVAAQPLDSRLLNLIPGDAWLVTAVDVSRYRDSALIALFPLELDRNPYGTNEAAARQVRQTIVAERNPADLGGPLTIVRGAIAAATGVSPDSQGREDAFVVLDSETAVYGDAVTVAQVAGRWRQTAIQNTELAGELARMSESFDNWFVAVRPLENSVELLPPQAPLKHRAEFMHLVREVRAGIRLGAINQIQVEVDMNTAEDAAGLVAIGRWLPGFLQMKGGEWEAAFADLAENVSVWQSGATASLSFTLDENKVKEFVKSRQELESRRSESVTID